MANPGRTDFEAFLRVFRRRGIWVVACALIAVGAAVAWSKTRPQQYTATADLLFRTSQVADQLFGSSVLAQTGDPARAAATDLQLVTLHVVAARTATALRHGLTAEQVASKIQVGSGGQSDIVTVSATDRSPEFATKLANQFGLQFVSYRRDADRAALSSALAVVENQLLGPNLSIPQRQDLQGRAEQLRVLAALQTGGVELAQPAVKPTSPSSPGVMRDAVFGGGLGILLGLVVALMLERFDRRIRDVDELKEAYGLPLLGVIPKSRTLRASSDGALLPRAEAEAFQMLRTAVRYAKVDRDIRSVLVASASPSEGKSTVAWNLAVAAASAGRDRPGAGTSSGVLLIEADFHRPSIAAVHGLRHGPGLGDLIADELPLAKVVQSVPVSAAGDEGPTLDVIPAGDVSSNPAAILQSAGASEVLSMLTRMYGLIVIDTPPSAVIADAIPLMHRVGAVLLVGRVGVTRRDAVRRLREQLANVDARVLGVVANAVTTSHGGYGDYGQYSGYGAKRNRHDRGGEDAGRSRRPVGRETG